MKTILFTSLLFALAVLWGVKSFAQESGLSDSVSTTEIAEKDSLLNIIDLNITITQKSKETLGTELIPSYAIAKERSQMIEETYDGIMDDYKDLYRYIKGKPNKKIMLSSIKSFKPSLQYRISKMGERADDFDSSIETEIGLILNTTKMTFPQKKDVIKDLTDMRTDVNKFNDKLTDYSRERLLSYIQSFW